MKRNKNYIKVYTTCLLYTSSPARTSLTSAKHIYWFESAYDAMAYYQLHQAENKELRKAVFISTGGAPSQQQFKGTIKVTPHASHHLCFDHDRAGQVYAIHFALTHAGWNFSTCLSQTGRLIVQDNSEGYPQDVYKRQSFHRSACPRYGTTAITCRPDNSDCNARATSAASI